MQTNQIAEKIVKKLTLRPEAKDEDGFYDIIKDEKQMISIVSDCLKDIACECLMCGKSCISEGVYCSDCHSD